MSGEHKNNRKDAAAVAGFAAQLRAQGTLEEYRHRWFTDPILRSLVRMHEQKQREATREINRLWRTIHEASGDLFLALCGFGAGKPGQSALTQLWVLKLISLHPDMYAWQSMSPQQLADTLGENRPAIRKRIASLHRAVKGVASYSQAVCLKLQISATSALTLKQAAEQLARHMKIEAEKNPSAVALMRYPGIDPIISSQIVSEIVDIRRFKNNHKLASYVGVGRIEHKTGRNANERPQCLFNRRLKNAFFNAARSFTVFNRDSHLTGYYRHLRRDGMTNSEAYKRVGRALIRVFYRELMRVVDEQINARHKGNPQPLPERSQDQEQPHASTENLFQQYHAGAHTRSRVLKHRRITNY